MIMSQVLALSHFATAPVNETASIVAMARDLLMKCDGGRQSLTLDGAVAKTILEELIALSERGARAVNPDIVRRETAFSSLVQSATAQADREVSVRDAWFMQDTPAAGVR